jgi:hypothetical protein
MAHFKFIGKGDDFEFLGRTFGRNDVITLDLTDESDFITILRGNPFFEEVEAGAVDVVQPSETKAAIIADLEQLGIEFNSRDSKDDLRALRDAGLAGTDAPEAGE